MRPSPPPTPPPQLECNKGWCILQMHTSLSLLRFIKRVV